MTFCFSGRCSCILLLYYFTISLQPVTLAEIEYVDWDVKCKLQANSYPCQENDSEYRYYYDTKLEDCLKFVYKGCESNYNNFMNREDCILTCRDLGQHKVSVNLSPDVYCRLQPDFGHCNSYYPMWYYDETARQCRGFSYSGCHGNMNRFQTSMSCASTCNTLKEIKDAPENSKLNNITTTHPPPVELDERPIMTNLTWQEYCKFQPSTGTCNETGFVLRQYYDVKMEDCLTYKYQGCPNNYNHFIDRSTCRAMCEDVGLKPVPGDVSPFISCNFQPDFGNCNSYVPMWYYDAVEQKCKGFSYSGCGGNQNRYETFSQCSFNCKGK